MKWVWAFPAHYVTPDWNPVTFDMTDHLKILLANRTWRREFDYGFSNALKRTDPAATLKLTISIQPHPHLTHRSLADKVQFIAETHDLAWLADQLPSRSELDSSRNVMTFELETSGNVVIPARHDAIDDKFVVARSWKGGATSSRLHDRIGRSRKNE